MPRIRDKAVIAEITRGNPIGEARGENAYISIFPMRSDERKNMVKRLDESIRELMDDAERTYQANCFKPGTRVVDPDYITRLSTNEFFFYTEEPLTLKEFEELQNNIAEKAKNLSPGVQLILGSFAVITDNGRVMNVTPHITCGNPPDFHFLVKNYSSFIDVRYKRSDWEGGTKSLPVLDVRNAPKTMPQIVVNGTARELTFNNIVPCKTPGGTPFLTAVDICLDHKHGVAKKNYEALAKKKPDILKLPVSHVMVSNTAEVHKEQCLGSLMHIDPLYSLAGCKKGVSQQKGPLRLLPFGNDACFIVEVAAAKISYQIANKYAYKISESQDGRDHQSYTAALSNINFQNQTSPEFQDFKSKYQKYKGDYLKTQILEDIKNQIQETSSKTELYELKEKLKNSYEYQVLKTGQGWFTQTFSLDTSSVKAFDKMFKQQEDNLSYTTPKSSV